MKKIFLSITLLAIIFLAACAEPTLTDETPTYNPEDASTVMTIDINPSITFTLDEDGVITGYVLSNEDAEIVAADLSFIGLTYEAALELFLDSAIETGYVDVTRSDNVVVVSLTSSFEEDLESLRASVQSRIQTYLDNKGVQAAVEDGAAYYEDIQATADDYDISVGHVILIRAAMRNDETLTFDEALATDREVLRETLYADFESQLNEYQSEREEEAAQIKDDIKELVQARIQEYRDAVDSGDETPPQTREELRNQLIEEFRKFKEDLDAIRNQNQSD